MRSSLSEYRSCGFSGPGTSGSRARGQYSTSTPPTKKSMSEPCELDEWPYDVTCTGASRRFDKKASRGCMPTCGHAPAAASHALRCKQPRVSQADALAGRRARRTAAPGSTWTPAAPPRARCRAESGGPRRTPCGLSRWSARCHSPGSTATPAAPTHTHTRAHSGYLRHPAACAFLRSMVCARLTSKSFFSASTYALKLRYTEWYFTHTAHTTRMRLRALVPPLVGVSGGTTPANSRCTADATTTSSGCDEEIDDEEQATGERRTHLVVQVDPALDLAFQRGVEVRHRPERDEVLEVAGDVARCHCN